MHQAPAHPFAGVPMVSSKIEPIDHANQLAQAMPMNAAKKRSLEGSPDGEDNLANIDDEKLAKKQRRLVKNREAAAQFRHRQKAYMQKLEKHAEELALSNVQVNAKIELLDSENKLMKEQLSYLRNFMKQAVALSFPGSGTLPSLPPDSGVPDFMQPAIPDLYPNSSSSNNNNNPPPSSPPALSPVKIESIVPDITNPALTVPVVPTLANPIVSLPNALPVSPMNSIPISSSTPPPMMPIPISTPSIPTPPATISAPPSPLPLPDLPPPTIIPTHHHHHNPPPSSSHASSSPSLITSTNILAPHLSNIANNNSLGASTALNASTSLSSSSTLSSIFNSILGTDLNFSGVIVKTEPDVPASESHL